MEHADGDAPIEGARQPDLDDDEQIKYIKHKVSVFVDDRSPGDCSGLPWPRARARARALTARGQVERVRAARCVFLLFVTARYQC
jgi:hypothetical protein